MTTDKKFKARIRARMAKTGESYATARRMILGPDATNRPYAPDLCIPADERGRLLLSRSTKRPIEREPFARYAFDDELSLGFVETVRAAPYSLISDPDLIYVVLRPVDDERILVKLASSYSRYAIRNPQMGVWYSDERIYDREDIRRRFGVGAKTSRPSREPYVPLSEHPGPYTFQDLLDVFSFPGRDCEAIVASSDPEMGPYTRYASASADELDERVASGWRKLTRYEEDEVAGEPEDFTTDWKHSD